MSNLGQHDQCPELKEVRYKVWANSAVEPVVTQMTPCRRVCCDTAAHEFTPFRHGAHFDARL